jgi:hypothetical protein
MHIFIYTIGYQQLVSYLVYPCVDSALLGCTRRTVKDGGRGDAKWSQCGQCSH